jgi:uncharacterized protein
MRLPTALAAAFFLVSLPAHAAMSFDAVITDPPTNAAHPAVNKQLLVPSGGVEMNALFQLAAGAELEPTVVLLHGLPGNEQNLDLAQAIRRAGWNVLTLHYRGSWGSPGSFSIANAVEDAEAAVQFIRQPAIAEKYRVDTAHIVIAGHSMGGFAAARVAAAHSDVAGLVLIDAWNPGVDARALRADPSTRAAAVASIDDLGHSLAGADAESLIAEIERSGPEFDLLTIAPALGQLPTLSVWADRGIAKDNAALAEAIAVQKGSRLTTAHFPTDHPFADHRIALARTVVGWLDGLMKPVESQRIR